MTSVALTAGALAPAAPAQDFPPANEPDHMDRLAETSSFRAFDAAQQALFKAIVGDRHPSEMFGGIIFMAPLFLLYGPMMFLAEAEVRLSSR